MSECQNLDPLVTPYVDGELAEADRLRIAQHLIKCPPCHSRVAAERAVRDAIHSRRGEMTRSCAPASLRAACERLRPPTSAPRTVAASIQPPVTLTLRRFVPFALVASLAVLVSGAFVYKLTDASATVMAAELAADHMKCFAVTSMLSMHETPSVVESAMVAGFGWQMHLPEHPAEVGLELVGSRPCMYGEGKVAHLMYRYQGHPVSLFMLPKSTRAEQVVEVLGHQAKIWCTGNRTLVLIAREPRRQVEQLAAYMQASLH
jgi:anti-sigma factor RsiW